MTRRKPTEPACRVCGCTEHAACDEGCSWVKVAKGEAPLCSACEGTAGDLFFALVDVKAMLGPKRMPQLTGLIKRALRRRVSRLRTEETTTDQTWGGR